jgi:hypothetical protein
MLSQQQQQALSHLSDTTRQSSLVNLAGQLTNILGSQSTTGLVNAINTLTNNVQNYFTEKPLLFKNIMRLKFHIDQLVGLNNSSVPQSTWATIFNRTIRIVNHCFGIQANNPTMASSDDLANALKGVALAT